MHKCTCGRELVSPEEAPGCYCVHSVEWVCPQFGLDGESHDAILKGVVEKVEITGDFYFGEQDEAQKKEQ